ncbi:MAG: DNA recombination protein RmuC [Gammaproteobacteria bacterium]|nr:DNA recombination protein RmuC [Gammaproteobacteria bacterium]
MEFTQQQQIYIGIAIAVIGIIGLILRHYSTRLKTEAAVNSQLETSLALKTQAYDQLDQGLQETKLSLEQFRQQAQSLNEDLHSREKTIQALDMKMQSERQLSQQKLQQFEENRKQLKLEFENLANQILKSSQSEFSQKSREGLDLFLKPFRQQVNDFKTRVEEIHSKELTQRAELKSELKQLHELNRQMTEEASNLTTALKGEKKTQGNWGELILENVLDRSGLIAGKDYQREVSFKTEDGRRRPDVIVYLPEEKHLVIDAKVSLNAYTRFVNSEDEAERALAIKEHVAAFAQRMSELSEKNYFDLPGIKSPEMVFMFVPVESAFVEAIKADEQLFHAAIDRRILITTPTTLLTSLNIVRQLWRFEDQNKHTARLADSASGVYNQLRLFLESMDSLGDQLDKAQNTYRKARDRLASGKGNLVKRVAEFEKLGISVKNEMPKAFVEQASLEMATLESSESD